MVTILLCGGNSYDNKIKNVPLYFLLVAFCPRIILKRSRFSRNKLKMSKHLAYKAMDLLSITLNMFIFMYKNKISYNVTAK